MIDARGRHVTLYVADGLSLAGVLMLYRGATAIEQLPDHHAATREAPIVSGGTLLAAKRRTQGAG